MHHWRPCLKLRSAILIVLSTVVAKDANHRFQSLWWKKRDRIGGNREAFSSLKTLGCVQRSMGCQHGDMNTETATGRPATCTCILLRQRARAVPQGQWTSRLLPVPFNPASNWSISPGPIFLEDSESVSTTFFMLLLHGLFLSFAFRFRVHVSFLTSTFLSTGFFFYGTCVYMYTTNKRNTINQQIGKC